MAQPDERHANTTVLCWITGTEHNGSYVRKRDVFQSKLKNLFICSCFWCQEIYGTAS